MECDRNRDDTRLLACVLWDVMAGVMSSAGIGWVMMGEDGMDGMDGLDGMDGMD